MSGEQVEADQRDEVGPANNEWVVPDLHEIIVGQEVYRTEVKDWDNILEKFDYKLVLITNQNCKEQNSQGW